MPKYFYSCDNCGHEYKTYHGINEVLKELHINTDSFWKGFSNLINKYINSKPHETR